MIDIKSNEDFYKVINSQETIMIYFYTNICPDCFAVKPFLPKLEEEYKEKFTMYSFNRNSDFDIAREFGIIGIPSFIIFKDGNELGRYVDKQRKSYIQVKQFIDSVL